MVALLPDLAVDAVRDLHQQLVRDRVRDPLPDKVDNARVVAVLQAEWHLSGMALDL
jgi:hypothetical protein